MQINWLTFTITLCFLAIITYAERKRSQYQFDDNYISRKIKAPLMFYILYLLTFPGTFMHELAHWVVGSLLGAKPTKFCLLPSMKDGRLGYVSFRKINFFNVAPIALAPVLLVIPALIMINGSFYFNNLIDGYICATLLHGSSPSKTDLRVLYKKGQRFFFVLLVFITLLYYSKVI